MGIGQDCHDGCYSDGGQVTVPVLLKGIEVGLTEPALQGGGWRHDWWDPKKDSSIGPAEAFGHLGFNLKADPQHPGEVRVVPGLRRRLQWFFNRKRR